MFSPNIFICFSLLSFSSSTQPTASKNTSVVATSQQKQVPTLLVTRHSLTPQNIEIVENKENEKIEEEQNLGANQSSKFLQTLFSPISLFQKRRKKTKAERRAQKAFRTITFIVGLFAILWSPYYVVATVYGFCRECIPMFLYNLSYYMCYLNSSLNPFAYALANRQFRSAFWKILKGNFRKTN
ncbi:unnamed protein product [Meloidogyne enterolobii]|uniref:Uncharacterized protein n=2 Tax=Meloidogyne enterolobii TaxID=390850 RepID=A0ACB1B604_MELEN